MRLLRAALDDEHASAAAMRLTYFRRCCALIFARERTLYARLRILPRAAGALARRLAAIAPPLFADIELRHDYASWAHFTSAID